MMVKEVRRLEKVCMICSWVLKIGRYILPPMQKKSELNKRVKSALYLFLILCVSQLTFILLLHVIMQEDSGVLATTSSTTSNSPSIIPDFNFVAVGDWGCTPNTINTVTNLESRNPELVLGLGDYSYQDSADCWLKIVDSLDHKMKIAIADHDAISSSLLNQYLRHFNLTQQYYSFNFHNAHLAMMSEEIPNKIGSEQYSFINDDLAAASSNSSIDWIIVMMHEPVYTSPYKQWNGMDLSFIETYQPLFDNYKVDLVLSGDIHNYQRSYPLRYNPLRHYDASNPSDAVTAPIITTIEKGNYTDPKGQIYITVGTGGAPLQTSLREQSTFIATQNATTHGILDIEIIDNGQTLVGTFYANDGYIDDRFVMDKAGLEIHSNNNR
jgi:predicted MPP superfamily phosphohydrolase